MQFLLNSSKIFLLLFYCFEAFSNYLPNSFNLTFEQKLKSSLSGKFILSKGSISYLRPNNIKIIMGKPDNIIFVSNGKKTWYYVPPFIEGEAGEVTISTGNDNILVNIFRLLNNGLSKNKIYNVTRLKQTVKLDFYSKEFIVKDILLRFKGNKEFKNIFSMDINYRDKKQITLKFIKMTINNNIKKSDFIFNIPKNTRVSY